MKRWHFLSSFHPRSLSSPQVQSCSPLRSLLGGGGERFKNAAQFPMSQRVPHTFHSLVIRRTGAHNRPLEERLGRASPNTGPVTIRHLVGNCTYGFQVKLVTALSPNGGLKKIRPKPFLSEPGITLPGFDTVISFLVSSLSILLHQS